MKLSREYIENLIYRVDYKRVKDTTTVVCMIVLKNRFVVVGKSACIDRKEFKLKLAKELSYKNAFNKIWQLEGYHHVKVSSFKSESIAELMEQGIADFNKGAFDDFDRGTSFENAPIISIKYDVLLGDGKLIVDNQNYIKDDI